MGMCPPLYRKCPAGPATPAPREDQPCLITNSAASRVRSFDEKETFAEHDQHPQVRCPHCGSTDVEPVMTPVEVRTSKKS